MSVWCNCSKIPKIHSLSRPIVCRTKNVGLTALNVGQAASTALYLILSTTGNHHCDSLTLSKYLFSCVTVFYFSYHTADDLEIITRAWPVRRAVELYFPLSRKCHADASHPKLCVLSSPTVVFQPPSYQTRILSLSLTPLVFIICRDSGIIVCLLEHVSLFYPLPLLWVGPYHSHTVSNCSPASRLTPLPSPFYQW